MHDKFGTVLYLIPCYGAYFQALYALRSIPDIQRNNIGVSNSTVWNIRNTIRHSEKSWSKFDKDVKQMTPKFDQLRFMIVRADGSVVGSCGVQRDARKSRSSVFYDVWPSMRRRGIAKSAALAMTDFFWKHCPGEDLYLFCLEDNVGSRKVAERANFKPMLDTDGKQHSEIIDKRRYIFYRKRAQS